MTEVTQDSASGGRWQNRVERWPRLTRIILTMVITTLLIAAIWLLITLIVGISSSSNATLRMLIILGGGIIVYVYGWAVLVGFEDGKARWHASTKTLWYLLIGLIALVFNAVMLAIGLVSANIV